VRRKMKSSVKPFGCAVCRKGFVSSKSLADHIKRFHEYPKDQSKFGTTITENKQKVANNSKKSKASENGGSGYASASSKHKRCRSRSKTFSIEKPSIITCTTNFKEPSPASNSDKFLTENYGNAGCRVFRGTKSERFLPKNQHTQKKLLNFENWCSEEVSKSAKI
jgi:hypothetical protein